MMCQLPKGQLTLSPTVQNVPPWADQLRSLLRSTLTMEGMGGVNISQTGDFFFYKDCYEFSGEIMTKEMSHEAR